MSFWGEIDPKKNKKEVLTQIRVPESLKPQRKRQPAIIIKGEEKLKVIIESTSFHMYMARLRLRYFHL